MYKVKDKCGKTDVMRGINNRNWYYILKNCKEKKNTKLEKFFTYIRSMLTKDWGAKWILKQALLWLKN